MARHERLITVVAGVLLLAMFCYIQVQVWPGIIGGGV